MLAGRKGSRSVLLVMGAGGVTKVTGVSDAGHPGHPVMTEPSSAPGDGAATRLLPQGRIQGMETEFRRAVIPDDVRGLRAFDRQVFRKADLFNTEEWKTYESWWMVVEGMRAGCCAFEPNVDFQEDIRADGTNPVMKGSLYISTTGILPRFQRSGLGRLFKSWQIAYARFHGFHRIVTNCRKLNTAIVDLNKSFGFRIIRTTPRYYSGPTDSTVVMERRASGP